MRNFKLPVLQRNGKSSGKFRLKCLRILNNLIFSIIFSGECAKVSDWLDEEAGVLTPVEEFQSKLKILKEMAAPVMARPREHRERPEALDVLKQSLNSSKVFLEKSRCVGI